MKVNSRALEVDPLHSGAWLMRARSLDLAGREREALRSYREFRALADPGDEAYVQAVENRIRELEEGTTDWTG